MPGEAGEVAPPHQGGGQERGSLRQRRVREVRWQYTAGRSGGGRGNRGGGCLQQWRVREVRWQHSTASATMALLLTWQQPQRSRVRSFLQLEASASTPLVPTLSHQPTFTSCSSLLPPWPTKSPRYPTPPGYPKPMLPPEPSALPALAYGALRPPHALNACINSRALCCPPAPRPDPALLSASTLREYAPLLSGHVD